MAQNDQENSAAPGSFFHASVLSRQDANGQIVMHGGPQGKILETLHSMLCELLLKDSRLARNRRIDSFPKMSTLLADKDGAFQITLGRGLPTESFRAHFISWLEFMRSYRIIEILPVLERRGNEIGANDYVIIQEDKERELSVEPFVSEAVKTSADAAGEWLASYFHWNQGLADDLLSKKDATFVRQLPYFAMLEALRGEWHPPRDLSHSSFANQMKGKTEVLTRIYNALLGADKLKFQTKLPGLKKIGDRFPFAWPGTAAALNDLVLMHERLRTIFVRDILMSEKVPGAPRPEGKSPLYHGSVTSSAFQTAYQAYVSSPDVTPTVSLAHKMGINFLEHNFHLFSQREETLRAEPGVLFARNVLVLMLMHGEAVLDYQKDKEKLQFYQALEFYVQKLAAADPPIVDLNQFVRLDKNVIKNEAARKKMIDAMRSHREVKSLEVEENPTFGQARLILFAFHTSQLDNVCFRSFNNGRERKDYSLHVNLERIYDCIQDPSKLQPLVRPETYERFLQTRQDYYVSQMPFWKRILWKLFGFARKIDPEKLKDFIKTTMHTETQKASTFKEQELRTEARKEQERIARRVVSGADRESAHQEGDGPLSDLEPVSSGAVSSGPVQSDSGYAAARHSNAGESSRTSGEPAHAGGSPRETAHRPAHAPADSQPATNREVRSPAAPRTNAAQAGTAGSGSASIGSGSTGSASANTFSSSSASTAGSAAASSSAAARPDAPRRAESTRPESEPGPRAEPERTSTRLSLEELSAKVDGPPAAPELDPDHIQFLKEKPKTAAHPSANQQPDWEQQVIIVGKKMGMDLTEERRLQRKKEKELHKQERHALAVKKAEEIKKAHARKKAAKPHAASPHPAAGPGTPKHLVIIEVPTKLVVSGKPVRIQFQKKFFKSESFRKEMADFYRKEMDGAASQEDKKYFAFLITAVERNYNQYLK